MRLATSFTVVATPVFAFAHAIHQRDLAPATTLPTGWTYQGCYVDSVSDRVLPWPFHSGPDITGASCIAFCGAQGYPVAGTEYGGECWCGLTLPPQLSDSGCDDVCTGTDGEDCGGSNRLSVYQNPSLEPVVNPGFFDYQSVGCFSDNVLARTLESGADMPPGAMTVKICIAMCKALGYSLAGVEFAQECFCGDNYFNDGAPALDGCSMPCTGNLKEMCGGRNHLNVYAAPNAPAAPTATATNPTASPNFTIPASSSSCQPTMETGILENGGFETGDLQPWNTHGSHLQYSVSNGSAYEGCYALGITPSIYYRSADMTLGSVPLNSPSSQTTLTFYAGRRSRATTNNQAVVLAAVFNPAGVPIFTTSFTACSGNACDLRGSNGTVWKKYSTILGPLLDERVNLIVSFNGYFDDNGSDDVLIDGISITSN
ncbi:WSC-domain-containing protein [Polyplosphaeria fusca]|uniref:WSC-domain-containing protein n=1 Tax=Polyplosphaeria fusca TaxID=682080 RepID=A0A9P4R778_9PLEO|nr:WSC-domain-containing protein [Polyplosphaeria fusca]